MDRREADLATLLEDEMVDAAAGALSALALGWDAITGQAWGVWLQLVLGRDRWQKGRGAFVHVPKRQHEVVTVPWFYLKIMFFKKFSDTKKIK